MEENLKNEFEAVVHFITKMDIEMLDQLLDPNYTYQDMEKYMFLNKLQLAFMDFKEMEDTFLEKYPGRCGRCDPTKTGFTFVGNNSRAYMDLIVEVQNAKVFDIYECTIFCRRALRTNISNRKVFIDDERTPF